ncbi:hypothetical protein HX798_22915 [Pseudomonas putida]|uniref:Uncharacterized protein n=1 Tax=Pseudomonas putida TaxID=303 RepID=A0A7Y8D2Z7_PSEPU|nr:hypothetical protein [Pseudomonas putida]NWC83117.1 hypothetical protein [Pseudomonas putida]
MDLFKQACWLLCETPIHGLLRSNSVGREDKVEKAKRQHELCSFYVAVAMGLSCTSQASKLYEAEFTAVYDTTLRLTDYLEKVTGFPLSPRADYDALAPLFFDNFHELALAALQTTSERSPSLSPPARSHQC